MKVLFDNSHPYLIRGYNCCKKAKCTPLTKLMKCNTFFIIE